MGASSLCRNSSASASPQVKCDQRDIKRDIGRRNMIINNRRRRLERRLRPLSGYMNVVINSNLDRQQHLNHHYFVSNTNGVVGLFGIK